MILLASFSQAARSPGRQSSFRRLVTIHLLFLAGGAWALYCGLPAPILMHLLLVTGILEGAALVGWRLTQLPKSQALEFLLVSPVRPAQTVLCECLVGICRLALVGASGAPVLLLLALAGFFQQFDVAVFILLPFIWGVVTGLGLTVWAYESSWTRWWWGRGLLAIVIIYLGIGLLAGEHLKSWVDRLPAGAAWAFMNGFEAFHRYNPFAVAQYWLEQEPPMALERLLGLHGAAIGLACLLLARAAWRLKAHFDELHYRPQWRKTREPGSAIGDWPLSWWTVQRVSRYAGRINLWLAAAFALAYAAHTALEPLWPAWLGRRAFDIFDRMGGIPVLAAALVMLSAVPACFQYGLWDSSVQDRCRRLELLLMTDLAARDYWEAAFAAAWRRGRGYLLLAVVLWGSAMVAGKIGKLEVAGAIAAAAALWGLYFVLGFRGFSRGVRGSGLGLALTLGVPALVFAFYRQGWPVLAAWIPAATIYAPVALHAPIYWAPGVLVGGFAALGLARLALARGDRDLRRWYDHHQGHQVVE